MFRLWLTLTLVIALTSCASKTVTLSPDITVLPSRLEARGQQEVHIEINDLRGSEQVGNRDIQHIFKKEADAGEFLLPAHTLEAKTYEALSKGLSHLGYRVVRYPEGNTPSIIVNITEVSTSATKHLTHTKTTIHVAIETSTTNGSRSVNGTYKTDKKATIVTNASDTINAYLGEALSETLSEFIADDKLHNLLMLE